MHVMPRFDAFEGLSKDKVCTSEGCAVACRRFLLPTWHRLGRSDIGQYCYQCWPLIAIISDVVFELLCMRRFDNCIYCHLRAGLFMLKWDDQSSFRGIFSQEW